MRLLPPPTLAHAEVYALCTRAPRRRNVRSRYLRAADEHAEAADLYRERAASHELFRLPHNAGAGGEQVVFGDLTKNELLRLYDYGMLGTHGRGCYDRLIASAPLGKCPYCCFGQVETLDHFLPKAIYPPFSVVPDNLVPACRSCNSRKGAAVLTRESDMAHPYFEDERISEETWLRAEVVETNPATVSYSFDAVPGWPEDLVRRMQNYFRSLRLAERFAVEAASEMVSLAAHLRLLASVSHRREHLQRAAHGERALAANSWKAALYTALAESHWYIETGYTGAG